MAYDSGGEGASKEKEDVGTTTVFVLVDSFMFQVILVALNWIKYSNNRYL